MSSTDPEGRATGNFELEDCQHRISHVTPAAPGYSVAEWEGDFHHLCSLYSNPEDIELHDVVLWLVVDHKWEDDEEQAFEFQSVEPWTSTGGMLNVGMYVTEGNWEQALTCNTNFVGLSQEGHSQMRVFGPTEKLRTTIAALSLDGCAKRLERDKDG